MSGTFETANRPDRPSARRARIPLSVFFYLAVPISASGQVAPRKYGIVSRSSSVLHRAPPRLISFLDAPRTSTAMLMHRDATVAAARRMAPSAVCSVGDGRSWRHHRLSIQIRAMAHSPCRSAARPAGPQAKRYRRCGSLIGTDSTRVLHLALGHHWPCLHRGVTFRRAVRSRNTVLIKATPGTLAARILHSARIDRCATPLLTIDARF